MPLLSLALFLWGVQNKSQSGEDAPLTFLSFNSLRTNSSYTLTLTHHLIDIHHVPLVFCFLFYFIYLFMYVFIYFWLCRVFVSVRGLSLVVASGGPLFIAVRGPLTIAASLVAELRLQTRRLSSCGSRA